MRSFKLIFTVLIIASLLVLPQIASAARDSVSTAKTTTTQAVKKSENTKEKGFFASLFDGIGSAAKSVVNFFKIGRAHV